MSEYQYYEFQALDRPLTTTEKNYVESLSSRVELTSTQAIFVYNYSDFRGNPEELLDKCFDVMLYMTNWGSRQLMFRFPKSLVDATALEAYCLEDKITVSTTSKSLIVDINIIDEDMIGWIDSGEGYLSALVPLRDDLLRGDYRCLYLAWLKAAPISSYEEEEDFIEPPLPNNLNDLSESLKAFIDFFEIDEDLIAIAATTSQYQELKEESLENLIPSLSEEEKNEFLVRVLKSDSYLGRQLAYRLRELSEKPEVTINNDTPKRTLSELLKLTEEQTQQRQEKAQEAARQEQVQKLEALAKRKDKVWEQVFELIALKQTKPYDQAVAYLIELRALAEYQGDLEEFQASIQQIQKDYSKRPGLISRLQRVGLLGK
ncbi:hypothetical protein F7734_40135 [Scytonema sp. UIC 10036]|uniref:hypothetical protein n=1 Tax=Scytonema sp. UIC 10036 TaxID=2304196 RepID=UPI00137FDE2F|nr:hypothetical protein [Scytonema sp. UIC 10036]MUG98190.1 hypothetical protein [Scytonema sp. UIC 10036]